MIVGRIQFRDFITHEIITLPQNVWKIEGFDFRIGEYIVIRYGRGGDLAPKVVQFRIANIIHGYIVDEETEFCDKIVLLESINYKLLRDGEYNGYLGT